ncbi:hypothetical protein [Janibacter sp. GXQ6167]|uniref:hypothetical protein n=1 Tax=Janibacter sp. GXQ6167 TaxID=3240791 RepID=UPI00352682FA
MTLRDAALLAGLGLTDQGALDHVIWEEPQQVFKVLAEVTQTAGVSGEPTVDHGLAKKDEEVATAATAAEGTTTDDDAAAPADEPDQVLAGLLQWQRAGVGDHPDLAALDEATLRRIASAKITSAASLKAQAVRFGSARSVVAKWAEELWGVLAGESLEPSDQDEPESAGPSDEQEAPNTDPPAWLPTPGPFASYDWSRLDQEAPEPSAMLISASGAQIEMTWPDVAVNGEVVLYRVVQSPDAWPEVAPDETVADLVGVATHTRVVKALPQIGAVTYLAVWANRGADEHAARAAQPELIAKGEVVWPPTDFSISQTPAGEVAGLFKAPPGASVEVHRFGPGQSVRYDPRAALPTPSVQESGFLDLEPPVDDLTYAAFTVAQLPNGKRLLSPAAVATVSVHTEPVAISLSVVSSQTRAGAYDISWATPEVGTVEIHLTNEQPPTGLGDEVRSPDAIERAGLDARTRVRYPPSSQGEHTVIRNVQLDEAWVRGYFVAVHITGRESARVGPTVSQVKPKPPTDLMLVERVDSQVLLLAWPDGIELIEVFQGPRGQEYLDPSSAEGVATLNRDEYQRMGGLHITRTLPPNGCSLHVFSVLYQEGIPTRSEAARVDYEGITRLRYHFDPVWRDGADPQKEAPIALKLMAKADALMQDEPMCLVVKDRGLPLHPQDGQMVQDLTVSLMPDTETTLAQIPWGARMGTVRLFLNKRPAESGQIAVLDPPLPMLRVAL